MLCLKVVKVMSNPSARELTDALLRTSKKSSLKQNIASVMKERASTLASNIVSVKKNIEPIVSLTEKSGNRLIHTESLSQKVMEKQEVDEENKYEFNDSDDELQYAINASLQHQTSLDSQKEIELMRLLEESNRRIALLQREKDEEKTAIMRLYEEDKKRREKEEAEKEEQRKYDELYKEFREKSYPLSVLMDSLGFMKSPIENILEKGEVVITAKSLPKYNVLITNKHLYIYSMLTSTGYGGKLTLEDYYITRIYTFLNTLSSKYLKLLLSKPSSSKFCRSANDDRTLLFIVGESEFESIIRCIPGSYINGHWKQLDGFFGAYFNEETIEISLIPPPLELK